MNYTNWLDAHPLVTQYEVVRHDQEGNTVFIKLQLLLIDGSVLYTKEYTDLDIRKYAFQWQTADNIWLMRWDNVPHFPKLASFPHHKHDYHNGSEVVTDSFDISLTEVLTYIHGQLKNSQS